MYGLLIREGKNRGSFKNIVDYVQSIAQRQFLRNEKTRFIDIEELSDFESEGRVNLIMNGWFTWNCSKFLPPKCINPLFVSFHLTPPKAKDFFTPEIIEYLKRYQPIGARDTLTMQMMKEHGIDSYFSGCLTLTLGKEYKTGIHDGKVLIVDPYIEFGGDKSLNLFSKVWNTIRFCIKYYNVAMKLKDNFINQDMLPRVRNRISRKLEHFIETATFYAIYSQRFSNDIIMNATYISVIVDNYISNEEKFKLADSMLKEYANAKCVITSRLHVSFPCLAVGTKNIFVIPSLRTEEKDVRRYSGRLKGLEDTVTVLELDRGRLINTKDVLPEVITIDNFPENKEGYKFYEKNLIEIVENFVNSNC